MRSSKFVRFASCTCLALGLVAGAFAVSAQSSTPEASPDATQEMMMSQMMAMQGACPQGAAAMMLSNMQGMATPMMGSTEDMSMMTPEATMSMDMTPAATMDMSMMTPEATGAMASGTEEMTGVICLMGQFSGAAEVPGPGSTTAAGFVFVSVDPSSGMICYQEAITGITLPALATHIHVNAAGQSGSVVVPFPVAPGADGKAEGCTTATVAGLAEAIATKPDGYYVNVHTSDFPNGAARAQLSAFNASMMSSMMTGTPMMSSTEDMGMMTSTPMMSSTEDMGMATPEATSGS